MVLLKLLADALRIAVGIITSIHGNGGIGAAGGGEAIMMVPLLYTQSRK